MGRTVWNIASIALAVAVTAVFVWQCEKAIPDYTNLRIIDSLGNIVKQKEAESARLSKKAADAFQRGLAAQREKVVIRTIYRQDIKANREMRKAVKDSLIKAMFAHDPTMDESLFSDEVATGVLDLRSENKALRADDALDSLTIEDLKEAYHAKDSACAACGEALSAQASLTGVANADAATAKKRAKKRGFFNWVLGGVAAVFAIIAATK